MADRRNWLLRKKEENVMFFFIRSFLPFCSLLFFLLQEFACYAPNLNIKGVMSKLKTTAKRIFLSHFLIIFTGKDKNIEGSINSGAGTRE